MITRKVLAFAGLLILFSIIVSACGGGKSEEQNFAEVEIAKPTAGPTTYSSQIYCRKVMTTMSTLTSTLAPSSGFCTEGVVIFGTSDKTISVTLNEKGKITQIVAVGFNCSEENGGLSCTDSTGTFTVTVEKPKIKAIKTINTGKGLEFSCPKAIAKDICNIAEIAPASGFRYIGASYSTIDPTQWVDCDWTIPGSAVCTWFQGEIPAYDLVVEPFICYNGNMLTWEPGDQLGVYNYSTKHCGE